MQQEGGDLTLFLPCSPVCCGIMHQQAFHSAIESDTVTVEREGTLTTEALSV